MFSLISLWVMLWRMERAILNTQGTPDDAPTFFKLSGFPIKKIQPYPWGLLARVLRPKAYLFTHFLLCLL